MEMTRAEFMEFVSKNGHEFYTVQQLQAFSEDIKKSIDPIEKEHAAIDFVSLERVEVRNEDLTKSIMFWRPAQIEWKEETDPKTLQKSRTGYYKDTPANRKKGVVGKPYGDSKAEDHQEPGMGSTLGRLKSDYAAAVKRGDKKAAAAIGQKIKEHSEKTTGKKSEKDFKEEGE